MNFYYLSKNILSSQPGYIFTLWSMKESTKTGKKTLNKWKIDVTILQIVYINAVLIGIELLR